MRYLLRPPSTPWITFDSEKVAEREASLLSSGRSSVSSEAGFFPPEMPGVAAPAAEPSNVVVTTEIAEPAPAPETKTTAASRRGARKGVFALAGLAALLAAGAVATASLRADRADRTDDASTSTASAAEASPREAPAAPPAIDVPAPPPTAVAAAAPPEEGEDKAEPKGFGRLVIRGRAVHHKVYFDGKLLLGHGRRRFMVFCGPHRISFDQREGGEPIDVPCNGTHVVSK